MNWFKKDKKIIDKVIDNSMDKFYENRVDSLMTQVEDLKKEIKRLEFKINTPKKYNLGQLVNGFTVFEINYLDYEVLNFCCFNRPSWEYKGINKQGEILVLK